MNQDKVQIGGRHIFAEINKEYTIHGGVNINWYIGDWNPLSNSFDCWGSGDDGFRYHANHDEMSSKLKNISQLEK